MTTADSASLKLPLTTADGTPLKASLARAERRNRNRALLLVAPLFLFIFVFFVVPIGDMLFRSVENQIVAEVLHRTVPLLATWDENSGALPPEEVFHAIVEDFKEGRENRTTGKIGRRKFLGAGKEVYRQGRGFGGPRGGQVILDPNNHN